METEQRKTNETNETKRWILSEQRNTRPPPASSRKKSNIGLIQNKDINNKQKNPMSLRIKM